MTLQDLGSIGEFVAAIATLATLVYLALQIRQNTKSSRSATYQAATRDILQAADQVTLDPELNCIYFEGLHDFDSLSREKKRRFASYMISLLRRYENMLYQTNAGMLDSDWWVGIGKNLEQVISQPGVQSWWKGARSLFRPDFQEFIDRIGKRE